MYLLLIILTNILDKFHTTMMVVWILREIGLLRLSFIYLNSLNRALQSCHLRSAKLKFVMMMRYFKRNSNVSSGTKISLKIKNIKRFYMILKMLQNPKIVVMCIQVVLNVRKFSDSNMVKRWLYEMKLIWYMMNNYSLNFFLPECIFSISFGLPSTVSPWLYMWTATPYMYCIAACSSATQTNLEYYMATLQVTNESRRIFRYVIYLVKSSSSIPHVQF